MHECMLCKKDMKKTAALFGRGCINYIYNSLDLDVKVKDKEKELCKYIKRQTNIKTISKQEEQILIDRYLTIHFLNKLKYTNIWKLKEKVNQDLLLFNKNRMCSTNDILLKEVYDLCRKQEKFDKNIKVLKENINNKSIDEIELIVAGFSFIFNLKRNEKQYKKDTFKKMQYVFWQTVVEGGRVFKNYDISAYFLQHSLEEKSSDLDIKNGFIVDALKDDNELKRIVNKVVTENKDKKTFNTKIKDGIAFENGDLFYSIHNANITISGKKDKNKWQIRVLINDTYDYTDFKWFDDYYNSTNNFIKSMFSSTLYNFAYYSQKLGVIKEYEINIWVEYEY